MTKRTELWVTLVIVLLLALPFVQLATVQPAAARPPLGISMDDGSSSLPAYNFSSDTDTGIYRKGSGNMVLVTNGTPAIEMNGMDITGKVLRYASTGQQIVCGSTTITGTGVIAHALATPVYVMAQLAQDTTGGSEHLSHTNSAATVTIKVWNSALTPAASNAGAVIDWCVIGTP